MFADTPTSLRSCGFAKFGWQPVAESHPALELESGPAELDFPSQYLLGRQFDGGLEACRCGDDLGVRLSGLYIRFLWRDYTGLGEADPAWAAGLTVMFLVPLISHSLEFLVHFLRGTPNLLASIIASASFTAISTLVNWYAIRHGRFTVGEGQPSLLEDLRRLPGMLFGLLTTRPNP